MWGGSQGGMVVSPIFCSFVTREVSEHKYFNIYENNINLNYINHYKVEYDLFNIEHVS